MSWTATALWAAGFLGSAALLSVLLYKRRFRMVPWFTMWIGSQVIFDIVGFLVLRYGSQHLYAHFYWTTYFIDVSLQIAVVLEIAATVLRRSGRWVEGARVRLMIMGLAAPLVALVMAWGIQPAAETRLEAWAARISLFTTILIVFLFVGVVAASRQLGLGWFSYTMRESYGFFLWVMTAFVTDTLHAYWRTAEHFMFLENARIVVFQAAIVYWIVAFWLPEPQLRPATMEDVYSLNTLKRDLKYSLRSEEASSSDGVLPK